MQAKGWTIVRRKISANGRMKITIYATIYTSLMVGKSIWFQMDFSEADARYEWESQPGLVAVLPPPACRPPAPRLSPKPWAAVAGA